MLRHQNVHGGGRLFGDERLLSARAAGDHGSGDHGFVFDAGGKIGEYRNAAISLRKSKKSSFEKFCEVNEMMEHHDKDALYQVHLYLPHSPRVRAIFDDALFGLCEKLMGSDPSHLLLEGPGIFINRPPTERLLAKWHSEAHYYPKRRRFLNVWFPIFDKKTASNGTMSFKVKSHKKEFPFSDYRGYSKATENTPNQLTQYEVPANFLEGYDEHWCHTEPGDLVLFDRNLIHRSNPNTSSQHSVAVVARIWDPTDDLTLSGSIAATPYGGNLGRADLIVNPTP